MFVKENYSQWMTYILSASFGTWPLFPTNVYSTSNEIQTASKISRKTKSWLRRYTICTIWLLITVWNHTYYTMHSWIERDRLETSIKISKYDAIAKKLLVVENWTFNLAAIINISTTLFTSQYIPTIFCSLEKVEKWIGSVKGKWILTKIRKTELGRSISWLLSIYFVIFITMALEYSGLLVVHRDAHFFNIIIQDLGKLSMTTFDLQFSNLCGYLEKLFYTINDILLEIKSAIENKEEITNPRNQKFNRKSIRFYNVVTRYPEICEINNKHAVLCELIGKINSIYQIQITLNIAACFFNTVCVLFTTISEYRANTDWTLWISGLLWVTYYILRIIMICTSASGVSDEANKSRMHLSCINNRSLDGKQKYEIEQFLRRLSATDIKFVLCNLMTVNTPLLTSAGVGVTTYLVIALQYTYTFFTTNVLVIKMPSQEQDVLFRSFSVAYYFSKIFGAMPVKIDKNGVSKTEKTRWCRIGIAFAVIFVALVFLSMMMTNELKNLTKFRGKKLMTIHDKTQTITAPMFLWSVVISQVFTIVSFIVLPMQLKELHSIFNKFRRISDSKDGIWLFGDDEKSEKMVKTIRSNTWRMIIFYIFLAVSSAISSFNRIRLSASWTFVIMVDVFTKKMEALSVCIEFCALCDILLHCFYSINENLSALKYRRRESVTPSAHPTLNEMIPPTHEMIKSMGRSHAQLCDIIEHVNKIYQLQNLFGIAVCTLKMLPHLFLTGIILTYSNFRIIHSSFFLWPAQYLYRVFILCQSATKVTNEAMKTFTYVGALYEEDIDENSKQEVVLFMERINNRSIQFSLCGLCKLDNECFFSNLVTVSGYFIIILQSYMTQIENWPTEIHSEWEGQN